VTARQRQETEANRFAICLLAPAPLVRPVLSSEPDLRNLQRLADRLEISLEATLRRAIDLGTEPLAAVWTHNGRIRSQTRSVSFPWLLRELRQPLSSLTQAWRAVQNARPGYTELVESPTAAWTDVSNSVIFEQTRVGKDGHAVTLLSALLPDGREDDTGTLVELGLPSFRSRSRR